MDEACSSRHLNVFHVRHYHLRRWFVEDAERPLPPVLLVSRLVLHHLSLLINLIRVILVQLLLLIMVLSLYGFAWLWHRWHGHR